MQGSVWGPLKCSVHMDGIGKKSENNAENVLKYKNSVSVPALAMIDDVVAFAKCGQDSLKTNTYINAKIEMKKLECGVTKCKKIHFGKENVLCPDLEVHGEKIDESDCEKYLGNLLASEGMNKKNINAKVSKGIGMVSQTMNILNQVSLGSFYVLRNCSFIERISSNYWNALQY